MGQADINILCTRPVTESLIVQAAKAGVQLDGISFIDTEPLNSIEVQQEIEYALLQSATVVFTSRNAVDAVAEQLEGQQPDWLIYCTGRGTLEGVEKYFGYDHVAGTANDAGSLAEEIIETSGAAEVIFFCGDQRRDELPDQLRGNNIEVNEIVVYQTISRPQRLNKAYAGIIFFSPSAVESFFQLNKAGEQTIFFAIGQTTAGEIKKHVNNRIVIADEPGKEKLVESALRLFQQT